MVEWPCCYDPLRLSLGSYDLFFTNISPPLSLLGPKSLGHGSRRAAQPPRAMLGHGSAVRERILRHGSAVRKNILGHGRPLRLASAGSCRAPSPRRPFGVLCSSVPQSDFHSHPPSPLSRGRTFVLGLAKRPASSRHRVVARSLALLSRPRPRPRPLVAH